MIDVINLQKSITLDTPEYRRFVKTLNKKVLNGDGRAFTVAFITDDRMRQLNEMFRGKDLTSDVLSFPHEADEFDPDPGNLGDIVISAEQAQKQAAENGLTLEIEIKQLILHGLLHLCGYDHETDHGEMNERELELRAELDIA
jgi:probable rRNA maturation factor